MDYKNTAIDHYVNCRELVERNSEIKSYFYAALELRFCLERLCFEYLVLLIGLDRPLSKQEKKYYKPKDIMKCLRKNMPHLEKHINFVNAVCAETEIPKSDMMVCPDLDWIHQIYGDLGNYLHSIRGDVEQDSLAKLVSAVEECCSGLPRFLKGRANLRNMPPLTQAIYEDYVNDRIDEA